MTKPNRTARGFVDTKEEAVAALRAAWALERDWRAEMRKLTAHDDGGMTHWTEMAAWEEYERPKKA